jgi:hypothetical protein
MPSAAATGSSASSAGTNFVVGFGASGTAGGALGESAGAATHSHTFFTQQAMPQAGSFTAAALAALVSAPPSRCTVHRTVTIMALKQRALMNVKGGQKVGQQGSKKDDTLYNAGSGQKTRKKFQPQVSKGSKRRGVHF